MAAGGCNAGHGARLTSTGYRVRRNRARRKGAAASHSVLRSQQNCLLCGSTYTARNRQVRTAQGPPRWRALLLQTD